MELHQNQTVVLFNKTPFLLIFFFILIILSSSVVSIFLLLSENKELTKTGMVITTFLLLFSFLILFIMVKKDRSKLSALLSQLENSGDNWFILTRRDNVRLVIKEELVTFGRLYSFFGIDMLEAYNPREKRHREVVELRLNSIKRKIATKKEETLEALKSKEKQLRELLSFRELLS